MSKPRATSQDVARAAGVSRTTVSFVLNDAVDMRISEKTRRRVLSVARKLNYHRDSTGRRLATGKTHILGLVISQSPDRVAADAFLPLVMHGLHQVAKKQDYHLLFYPREPDKDELYTHLIHERHVDGIILSGPRTNDTQLLKLVREGVPIILLGQLPDTGIPFVDVDNVDGARMAVDHLLELGHVRIGMITNAPTTYTASRDRLAGYKAALKAHHIAYDKALVHIGDRTEASGEAAMNRLLEVKPSPTAVFVASDVVALGTLRAIKAHGLRIPSDLSLVGFDDIPASSYVEPPLTTVRLPAYELGWNAGERLIQLINGESLREPELLLKTELIIRNSTRSIV